MGLHGFLVLSNLHDNLFKNWAWFGLNFVRFEVLTAMIMKSSAILDVMPHNSDLARSFEECTASIFTVESEPSKEPTEAGDKIG
jgi:hypothetical protein